MLYDSTKRPWKLVTGLELCPRHFFSYRLSLVSFHYNKSQPRAHLCLSPVNHECHSPNSDAIISPHFPIQNNSGPHPSSPRLTYTCHFQGSFPSELAAHKKLSVSGCYYYCFCSSNTLQWGPSNCPQVLMYRHPTLPYVTPYGYISIAPGNFPGNSILACFLLVVYNLPSLSDNQCTSPFLNIRPPLQ